MAFRHGKTMGLFYNASDLSPYFKEASVSHEIDTAETSAFGSTHKTYVTGQIGSAMSCSGMFDGAVGAVDDVLKTTIGAEVSDLVTLAPDGVAVGRACYSGETRQSNYEISSPVSDVVAVNLDLQMDGGARRGLLLGARTAAATTGNGASSDNLALTSNGGVGVLHVTANTRDGSTVIKVQHSVDNSAWADLITFTTVPTVTTATERIAVTGTVNRYVRALHTPGGSTGSVTYTLAFART